jgi:tRNA threonylcarbamoyladenosine biosynthesis protein TsaB
MLLAIDTSTQTIGLALFDGARIPAELVWQTRNHHTVELSPGVNDLLERSGVKPAELEAIGIALGPGSFTSLRIGLALAKGMALALKIPLVGVPTLDILAASIPVHETFPLAALLQAGRGRLALVWYQAEGGAWKAQGEPQLTTAEELAQQMDKHTLIAGELTATERQAVTRRRRYAHLVSPAHAMRRPSFLAEIAWSRWRAGQVDDVIALAPIYLHVAEAIPA